MYFQAGGKIVNGDQLIVIKTKNITYQDIIGKAPDASFRDIKLANLMYTCDGEYHSVHQMSLVLNSISRISIIDITKTENR